MDLLDLNIENYSLNDLLNLFKLKNDFNEEELKKAKKIVLKMHPDKSKLDKKYFLFFSSAYKILFQLYNFKNRIQDNNTEYYVEEDENNKLLIEKIVKKENFNEWFNKEFEKININKNDDGYEEWLKSNENIDYRTTTKNNLNKDIEIKKGELRSLIKREEVKSIQELQDNNILGSNGIQEYSSDLFGNFRYEDVKKAHIESVIPVTDEDYDESRHFSNMQELSDYRNTQNLNPLSLNQAKNYLHKMKNHDDEINMNRAYALAMETEKNYKINNEWWKNLRQIK